MIDLCPVWNKAAFKFAETPYPCPFEENNCGLFYDEEGGTCKLLEMTLRVKKEKGELDYE